MFKSEMKLVNLVIERCNATTNNSQSQCDIPSSRSQWAKLEWQQAQKTIGLLLNLYGFMKFEEYNLGDGKRADLLVWRTSSGQITIGLIEVKTYQKISPSIEAKALQQVLTYFKIFAEEIKASNQWNSKTIRFFVCVIFTKDYPSLPSKLTKHHLGSNFTEERLHKDNIDVFVCTPERFILELVSRSLVHPSQQDLKKYFDSTLISQ